jgi:purine-nucleoside phosphorylase
MGKVGVVLGSGLGAFAEVLENRTETDYSQIAGWPISTAAGHPGKLVEGRIGGLEVIVMAGRAHLYEGYTPQQVVFGIRELHRRDVHSLILTNAAGAINLNYHPGELVLISDHINLLGVNPLTGSNDESLGPRFPDMSDAYSHRYRAIAKKAGEELGLTLAEGVYAAVGGPSYETPAEIRYLRTIGADLVGMSTVLETIAANHMGIKLLGISCVTNMAAGVLPQELNHSDVLEIGERVREKLAKLLVKVVPKISEAAQARSAI